MNTSYRIAYGEVVFVYEFIHTESMLGCRYSKKSGNSLEGFFFLVQCYNSRIQEMVRSILKVLNKCFLLDKSKTSNTETALCYKGFWTEGGGESRLRASIHLSVS